jgi:hypothetical protein
MKDAREQRIRLHRRASISVQQWRSHAKRGKRRYRQQHPQHPHRTSFWNSSLHRTHIPQPGRSQTSKQACVLGDQTSTFCGSRPVGALVLTWCLGCPPARVWMARNSLPVFVHHKRNIAIVGVELCELSYFQYACEKLSEIEGCLRSQHHVHLTTALR